MINRSIVVFGAILLFMGCQNERTAYHSGPTGSAEPAYEIAEAGGGRESEGAEELERGALAPPRILIPGQGLAETFGTAAGRTYHPPVEDGIPEASQAAGVSGSHLPGDESDQLQAGVSPITGHSGRQGFSGGLCDTWEASPNVSERITGKDPECPPGK